MCYINYATLFRLHGVRNYITRNNVATRGFEARDGGLGDFYDPIKIPRAKFLKPCSHYLEHDPLDSSPARRKGKDAPRRACAT